MKGIEPKTIGGMTDGYPRAKQFLSNIDWNLKLISLSPGIFLDFRFKNLLYKSTKPILLAIKLFLRGLIYFGSWTVNKVWVYLLDE